MFATAPRKRTRSLRGWILMIAAVQENTRNVRLVFDYCELNEYVEGHTVDADECAQYFSELRQRVLACRNAYLQVRVHKSLCPFQTIILKGCRYCLIWIGLNVSPKIMKSIVYVALSVDESNWHTVSAVNTNIVSMSRVHLADNG